MARGVFQDFCGRCWPALTNSGHGDQQAAMMFLRCCHHATGLAAKRGFTAGLASRGGEPRQMGPHGTGTARKIGAQNAEHYFDRVDIFPLIPAKSGNPDERIDLTAKSLGPRFRGDE